LEQDGSTAPFGLEIHTGIGLNLPDMWVNWSCISPVYTDTSTRDFTVDYKSGSAAAGRKRYRAAKLSARYRRRQRETELSQEQLCEARFELCNLLEDRTISYICLGGFFPEDRPAPLRAEFSTKSLEYISTEIKYV
jgi:hypothetical protein